jgi:hypothetical protein
MTEALDTAIAEVVGTLEATDDPVERYQATRHAETAFAAQLKNVRKDIAMQLKHEQGKTWREIGEIMGGVTAQRAEQISRGV